jgi:hypothetical protein
MRVFVFFLSLSKMANASDAVRSLMLLFLDDVMERSNFDVKLALASAGIRALSCTDRLMMRECELNASLRIQVFRASPSASLLKDADVHACFESAVHVQLLVVSRRAACLADCLSASSYLLLPNFVQQQQEQYVRYCTDQLLDALVRPRMFFGSSVLKGEAFSVMFNPFHGTDPHLY